MFGYLKVLALAALSTGGMLAAQTGFDGGGSLDVATQTGMDIQTQVSADEETALSAEADAGIETQAELTVANECVDSCLTPCASGCGPVVSGVDVNGDVAAAFAAGVEPAQSCACGGDRPDVGLSVEVEGTAGIDTTQPATDAVVTADALVSIGD